VSGGPRRAQPHGSHADHRQPRQWTGQHGLSRVLAAAVRAVRGGSRGSAGAWRQRCRPVERTRLATLHDRHGRAVRWPGASPGPAPHGRRDALARCCRQPAADAAGAGALGRAGALRPLGRTARRAPAVGPARGRDGRSGGPHTTTACQVRGSGRARRAVLASGPGGRLASPCNKGHGARRVAAHADGLGAELRARARGCDLPGQHGHGPVGRAGGTCMPDPVGGRRSDPTRCPDPQPKLPGRARGDRRALRLRPRDRVLDDFIQASRSTRMGAMASTSRSLGPGCTT
jgi:hypothetical protein